MRVLTLTVRLNIDFPVSDMQLANCHTIVLGLKCVFGVLANHVEVLTAHRSMVDQ